MHVEINKSYSFSKDIKKRKPVIYTSIGVSIQCAINLMERLAKAKRKLSWKGLLLLVSCSEAALVEGETGSQSLASALQKEP